MNEPEEYILLCALWGNQVIPSVQRECHRCHVTVAMDEKNVAKQAELNMKPICWGCYAKMVNESGESHSWNALLGGREFKDVGITMPGQKKPQRG